MPARKGSRFSGKMPISAKVCGWDGLSSHYPPPPPPPGSLSLQHMVVTSADRDHEQGLRRSRTRVRSPWRGWLGHASGERAAERGLVPEWTRCARSEVTDSDQDVTHCGWEHTHSVLTYKIPMLLLILESKVNGWGPQGVGEVLSPTTLLYLEHFEHVNVMTAPKK